MTIAYVYILGVPKMAELLTGSADLCTGDLEFSWAIWHITLIYHRHFYYAHALGPDALSSKPGNEDTCLPK